PAQPFSAAPELWKPPWWMTRIGIFTPASARAGNAAFAASASSWNVSPATPVGVTIVGVDRSTSPMNPTLTFDLPSSPVSFLIPNAGNSGRPVESSITFADRYLKSAPGYLFVEPPLARAYGAPVQPSG